MRPKLTRRKRLLDVDRLLYLVAWRIDACRRRRRQWQPKACGQAQVDCSHQANQFQLDGQRPVYITGALCIAQSTSHNCRLKSSGRLMFRQITLLETGGDFKKSRRRYGMEAQRV